MFSVSGFRMMVSLTENPVSIEYSGTSASKPSVDSIRASNSIPSMLTG